MRKSAFLWMLILLGTVVFMPRAQATWHTVMGENFERPFYQWPWTTAGRTWFVTPGWAHWGIQAYIYHGNEETGQSAWCYGYPNTTDPEYDNYPRNFFTYMRWGPFDLSDAEAALAGFYLLDRTEAGGDSVYWAASVQGDATELGRGGSHSGTCNWEARYMDFADLRDANGDSVSLLGEPTVYIYFLFRSDADASVDIGSFIDDLDIAWDDGLFDLQAIRLTLLGTDSTELPATPAWGDTVIAQFRWVTFGNGLLPPFYLTASYDDIPEVDMEINWAEGQQQYMTYYPAKVMTEGDHEYLFELDPMDDIAESYEDNNTISMSFHVDLPNFPPTFTWLRPGAEPDTAEESYLLQWDVFDAEDDAVIYLYYDTDTLDYNGYIIPGGAGISEDDDPDTLRWTVAHFPDGEELWPYARVDDPINSIQLYADAPIIIRRSAATTPQIIPRTFQLSQNYPNPFNEATTIQFTITRAGPVTLRVTDLLGKEARVLLSDRLSHGTYSTTFNAAGWSSGLYFYTLSSSEGSLTRKMILLK